MCCESQSVRVGTVIGIAMFVTWALLVAGVATPVVSTNYTKVSSIASGDPNITDFNLWTACNSQPWFASVNATWNQTEIVCGRIHNAQRLAVGFAISGAVFIVISALASGCTLDELLDDEYVAPQLEAGIWFVCILAACATGMCGIVATEAIPIVSLGFAPKRVAGAVSASVFLLGAAAVLSFLTGIYVSCFERGLDATVDGLKRLFCVQDGEPVSFECDSYDGIRSPRAARTLPVILLKIAVLVLLVAGGATPLAERDLTAYKVNASLPTSPTLVARAQYVYLFDGVSRRCGSFEMTIDVARTFYVAGCIFAGLLVIMALYERARDRRDEFPHGRIFLARGSAVVCAIAAILAFYIVLLPSPSCDALPVIKNASKNATPPVRNATPPIISNTGHPTDLALGPSAPLIVSAACLAIIIAVLEIPTSAASDDDECSGGGFTCSLVKWIGDELALWTPCTWAFVLFLCFCLEVAAAFAPIAASAPMHVGSDIVGRKSWTGRTAPLSQLYSAFQQCAGDVGSVEHCISIESFIGGDAAHPTIMMRVKAAQVTAILTMVLLVWLMFSRGAHRGNIFLGRTHTPDDADNNCIGQSCATMPCFALYHVVTLAATVTPIAQAAVYVQFFNEQPGLVPLGAYPGPALALQLVCGIVLVPAVVLLNWWSQWRGSDDFEAAEKRAALQRKREEEQRDREREQQRKRMAEEQRRRAAEWEAQAPARARAARLAAEEEERRKKKEQEEAREEAERRRKQQQQQQQRNKNRNNGPGFAFPRGNDSAQNNNDNNNSNNDRSSEPDRNDNKGKNSSDDDVDDDRDDGGIWLIQKPEFPRCYKFRPVLNYNNNMTRIEFAMGWTAFAALVVHHGGYRRKQHKVEYTWNGTRVEHVGDTYDTSLSHSSMTAGCVHFILQFPVYKVHHVIVDVDGITASGTTQKETRQCKLDGSYGANTYPGHYPASCAYDLPYIKDCAKRAFVVENNLGPNHSVLGLWYRAWSHVRVRAIFAQRTPEDIHGTVFQVDGSSGKSVPPMPAARLVLAWQRQGATAEEFRPYRDEHDFELSAVPYQMGTYG